MSFNGQGVFNPLYNWQQDAAQGLNIQADRMQGQDQDMANGLSNCITKDGQSTPTANLKMGGFRHTNASAGVADSDYATMAQLNAVKAALNAIFPIGMRCQWDMSVGPIPQNFQICDGTNGTPNMTGNTFPMGVTTDKDRSTGGASTVTLSVANLAPHGHVVNDPPHNHGVNDPSHSHLYRDSNGANAGVATTNGGNDTAGGGSGSRVTASNTTQPSATGISLNPATTGVTVQSTGSGTPFNITPPYIGVVWVQRMS
ncbi:hypothetical protein [Robbsia andropogonis]|uniref:hypothetical protein n=1 Tax=Robbsia andropogonis TaxID=28092 RepID=UPI000697067E|nr:hypothetical protein [Robbsia andropogonis]